MTFIDVSHSVAQATIDFGQAIYGLLTDNKGLALVA
jgi:hypothetical protein